MTNRIGVQDTSEALCSVSTDRPRLQIDLRDPSLMDRLKDQAAASDQSLKTLVNDTLERFVALPPIFSEQPVENLARMVGFFETLPMSQIYQLAQNSHRSPDQMLIHLVMKGLTAYTALDAVDRD